MALGSIAAEGSSTLSPLTMWLPGSLASRSKPVAGDDAQRLRPHSRLRRRSGRANRPEPQHP